MAGEMFGAPAGISHAIGDQNTIANTTKLFGEIAMQPAEALLKAEQARYFGSRAGVQEQTLRNQQLLAQRLQEMEAANGPAADPIAGLENLGSRLATAANLSIGLDPQNASRYAVAAGSVARAAGQAHEQAARTEGLQIRDQIASLDRVMAIMNDVTVPFEQRKALAQQIIKPDSPEEQAFLNGLTDDPASLRALGNAMMGQKNALQAQLNARRETRLAASAQIRDAANSTLNRVRQVTIKKIEEQTQAIRKAQGKPLKALTTAERLDAQSLLKKTYPVFEDESYRRDLDVLSTAVAQDAQELVAKGVPKAAALQQAVTNRAGDLELYKVSGGLLGKDKQGVRVQTGGHTAAEALPVPANPAQAIEGRYYRNAQGVLAIRRKGGWEPVQGGMSAEEAALINEPDAEDNADDGED